MAPEKASAADVISRLEGLTIGELGKVIAAAEQQREAKRETGKKELVEEFRARAEALGLSLGELAASCAWRPFGRLNTGPSGTGDALSTPR